MGRSILSRVPISSSVSILDGVDLLDVMRSVDEWTVFKLKGPANHVFDASWVNPVLWNLISQFLHVHGVVLENGALIQSSSAHDPFG